MLQAAAYQSRCFFFWQDEGQYRFVILVQQIHRRRILYSKARKDPLKSLTEYNFRADGTEFISYAQIYMI